MVETLSEFDCDCFSLRFCRNVNTYIYIYKSCGYVNTYIYLVIFVSPGLTPQVLDIFVTTGGGGPLPNQKTPKQRASLDRITAFFFSRFGFNNQSGVKQIEIALKTTTKKHTNDTKIAPKGNQPVPERFPLPPP